MSDRAGRFGTWVDAVAITPVTIDWLDVHRPAETLSKKHTPANGHRRMDILHVATALHLGAKEFLAFDARQHKLVPAAALKVEP